MSGYWIRVGASPTRTPGSYQTPKAPDYLSCFEGRPTESVFPTVERRRRWIPWTPWNP